MTPPTHPLYVTEIRLQLARRFKKNIRLVKLELYCADYRTVSVFVMGLERHSRTSDQQDQLQDQQKL